MIKLSEQTLAEIEKAAAKYPDRNSTIMPALWAAQREFGYLSEDVMSAVAEAVGVSRAKAQGLATYHTLYWKEQMGKYVVMLCTNVACTLMGAETMLEHLEKKLGVTEGHTTDDGMFTLMELTESRIDEILASCK
jgi:NADH:ubiquinone oxidoreductase subunit E